MSEDKSESKKEEKPEEQEIATRLHRHKLLMGALGLGLHPRDNLGFVACMDGVYELDLESGDATRLYQHDSYATNVTYVPETNHLVSAGYDGALQWFDLKSRTVTRHIQAHSFWSWDMAKANNAPTIVTVSGQYLPGSYDYRPKPSSEPCVRVFDARNGSLLHDFEHLPPVQAAAISDDGQRIGVGNLMGDVGVWDLTSGKRVACNTPDFTGFGIIKSHCQIGGIYAAAFSDQAHLLVAGMGPMRDPMAGNGKQRWQCFKVGEDAAEKISASKDSQAGEGLMETLAMHPDGCHFVMAGRLRGGSWNVGLFNLETTDLIHSFKTDTRVTHAKFSDDGKRLFLAGADKQHKDAKKPFGVVDVFKISLPS